MGCQNCKKVQQSKHYLNHNLDHLLIKIISQDDKLQLQDIIKEVYSQYSSDIAFFDSYELKCKSLTLNCLSFCLIIGSSRCFKLLIKLGSSLNRMEKILLMQQIDPMRVISAKGYTKIMKLYLPKYLANQQQNPDETHNKNSEEAEWQELYIHTATRLLMLPFVYYVYKTFENKVDVPEEFNIHSKRGFLGENCALIACRKGSLPLIKLLYEFCHADFSVKNAVGENAIIVCLRGFSEIKTEGFFNCVVYLVETVGIDVLYRYEEILSLAEDEKTVKFLEQKLESKGINQMKKNLLGIVVKDVPAFISPTNSKLVDALNLTRNTIMSLTTRS